MTLEERIAQLETELEKLRGKTLIYAPSAYSVAAQNCKAVFEQEKTKDQTYRGKLCCEAVARSAFCEKHKAGENGKNRPQQYIRSEEDGAEYVALFKAFLAVYQNYLKEESPVR